MPYLNEPIDVTRRNLVERHVRESLQVCHSHDLMSPVHHQSLVIPYSGRSRVNILLLLTRYAQPFRTWSRDLFN